MISNRAVSIMTRGRLSGALPLSTCGYIVKIIETTPPPSTGGRRIKSYQPFVSVPKLITLIVVCETGHVFKKSVLVNKNIEVSAKDVKVVKTEDGRVEVLLLVEPYMEIV